eukprot:COSAG02_NODE_2087_length_9877_cov_286.163939_1_plen_2544_part_00
MLRAAGRAVRAASNAGMWSAERTEPFAIGDRIEHLLSHEWHPAIVVEYTPKGQPTPWRVAFEYDEGGMGAVLLDDAFNEVRFVPFRVGDAILHESDGKWYPATVTSYIGQGEASPWQVEFEYDEGGFGSVLLDDAFNTVVRAKRDEPESDPDRQPEPEPEAEREPETGDRDFADLMAELQADAPSQGADMTAEVQKLRRQLVEAKEEAKLHEMARAGAEEKVAWCRKQQKNAERWAAQLSHERWAQRRLDSEPPERVVRDDLHMSKFSDEEALNLRAEHSRVHWQLSKAVWARLTYPSTGRALRPLTLHAIMERLYADDPGVQEAGGRPWLLFPTYERRAELFWKYRASAEECEAASDAPTHERPVARRMLMTPIGAQRAIAELWPRLKNQVALGRAFHAACSRSELVEWTEFAPLLRATIFFQEMWARLEEISERDDATLNVNDFRAACALMGQRLSDTDCQAEHQMLRAKEKGRVFFLTFCVWLARRHIYNDEDRLEPIPWATPFELQLEKDIEESIAREEDIQARRAQVVAEKAAAVMQRDANLQEALRAEEQKDPEARAITLLFGPLWVNITDGDIHGTAKVDDVRDAVFSDPIIQAVIEGQNNKPGDDDQSTFAATAGRPHDASIHAIKQKLEAITRQMDTDGDGVVTWEEFVNFLLLTLFGESGLEPSDLDQLKALKKPRNFKSQWQSIRALRQVGLQDKSQDMDESMLRALKAVAGDPSQTSLDSSTVAAPGDNHPIAPQLSRDSIEALSPRGGVASEQLSASFDADGQHEEDDFETGPGEFYYQDDEGETPKVGVEEALGLMARGVLHIDANVWASGMDDWVSWGQVKDEWLAGIEEPLFQVGEWVYVWHEFKWHYATVTRYTPSNAHDGRWSVTYTFADYSHGVFDGTVLLDDAFDTVRHGPQFRVGDRINVREQNGSQWFEATVTSYVPQGHETEPWRVEFSHDEGGAKQSVLLDDSKHTVRRVFYRQGDRIKVKFTEGARKKAGVLGKQAEQDPESPKALLTELIKEVSVRMDMAVSQHADDKEIHELKQHRAQLHAEYEKQVGEPYYPGEWLNATVTSYHPRGDSEPWRVAYFFDTGGAGAQLLEDNFDRVRILHRSSGDPNHIKLPPLNIGALFQRFLGVIFEQMDADRDGSVSRKEAILAARDSPVIRTLLGLPTNERQTGLGKGLRPEDKRQFDKIFKGVDSDRSGSITISEFITFMKAKLGDVPGLISEEEHDENLRQTKSAVEEALRKKQSAPALAQLCGALSAKHFGRQLAKRVSKWIRMPRQPVRASDWHSSRRLSVPNNQDRETLFTRWARQNGQFLTLSDANHAVEELWPWWMVRREVDPKTRTLRLVAQEWKPPLVRAYRAADTTRCGWIGRAEFRMLLLYTVYFNDEWERLDQVHPIIRTATSAIAGVSDSPTAQTYELDDTAPVDEGQFIFMCCQLGVMKGHHQDPLKRIEGNKLFTELREKYQPLAVRQEEDASADYAADPAASADTSVSSRCSASPTYVHFGDFCSWLVSTHVHQRGVQSQKVAVDLLHRIVAHCENDHDIQSRDEASRLGVFYPLVKMLSEPGARSTDLELLACKVLFLLSKDHSGRQAQIVERGALLPVTRIVLRSRGEAAVWATGVMANVCSNESICLVGGSQESTGVCDALIHATANSAEQQLEHATHAIAGVARTNAANRAKLVESGVINLLINVLSEGTQKLAEARAKAQRDLDTRSRLETKPDPWQEQLNAYFLLFEEDREMYPVGGHRFKGTATTGPFIRGIPRAAMTKQSREQLVNHARRLVALEDRLEAMTLETLHGLCPGAKRWAAEALATIVLEAGSIRNVDTMGSAVCAAGALEPLLLLVHHSRDERRSAGLRALAAIAPYCAELAPEHAHEVSQMLSAVAEASQSGLPRHWAVISLFTLLGSRESARLRLPVLAGPREVAAALCEVVENCNETSVRSAAGAALALALLCRGDDELMKAMVLEESGLAPKKLNAIHYHSAEEPSSDEYTDSEEEELTDENENEEATFPPTVTSKSGAKALLGLLSSKRKSGDKELDWSSASAACRALSVCAAHSVQIRESMGAMEKGDVLKKLVVAAIDSEYATEAERDAKRAQSAIRIDRQDGRSPARPIQQSIALASLLLWSISAIAALAKDCVANQLALVLLSVRSKRSSAPAGDGIVPLLARILGSSASEVYPAPASLLEQTALAVAAVAQNVDETKAQLMRNDVAPALVSLLELASGQPPATRAAAAQAIAALVRNATAHKSIFIQLGAVQGLVRCVQGPRSDGKALKLAAGTALQFMAVNNPSGMRAIIRDGGKVALQLTQRLIKANKQDQQKEQSSPKQVGLQRVPDTTSHGGDSRGGNAPRAPRKVIWDDLDGRGAAAGVTARAARRAMAFEDADQACTLSAPFPNRASAVPAPLQALELANTNEAGRRVEHGRRKGSAQLWPAAAAAASAGPRVGPNRRPPAPKISWRTQLAGGAKLRSGSHATRAAAKKPHVVAKMGGEPRWVSGRRGYVKGEMRGRRSRWLSTENLHYANGGGQPDNLFRGNY